MRHIVLTKSVFDELIAAAEEALASRLASGRLQAAISSAQENVTDADAYVDDVLHARR